MQVTCAAFRQSPLACRSQQQPHQQQRIIPHASPVQQQSRRQLIGLAAAAALTAVYRPAPAAAAGIESIDLPSLDLSDAVTALKARNQGVLDSAEKTFQESGGCHSMRIGATAYMSRASLTLLPSHGLQMWLSIPHHILAPRLPRCGSFVPFMCCYCPPLNTSILFPPSPPLPRRPAADPEGAK